MASHSIDLGWFRIFHEVGKLGSLSAAAVALHLTQPAVSYQMRRLEEQLGVSLLRRLHRGVELTPEGQQLFEIVSKAVDDVDALARRVRGVGCRPTVRLWTDYAFSSLWLIPRMHAFRLLYPEMDIQIVATQRLAKGLPEDDDVAVVFGENHEFDADAILLLPERVVPVCTPGFLDRHGPFVDSHHLTRATLIHLDSPSPCPWFDWRNYLSALGIDRGGRADCGDLSFNTYSLVIQAALGGQGLALGWMGLVDPLLSARTLVVAGPLFEAPSRGYWLLLPKSRSPHTQRLRDWLVSEAPVAN